MRLRVVLLRPIRGANVGAVCRAIKNMGASELVVVGGEYDAEEARRTAVHADDVFASIRHASSLEEALAPATFVIGTTSRTNPWNIPVAPIDEVLADARLGAGMTALVFGPEDNGLANEELARCHRLATVPTAGTYESLNLAQAAVVCLYEWMRAGRRVRGADPPSDADLSNGAARLCANPARLCADDRTQAEAIADFEDVLAEIGFLGGDQAERVMATIRSMLTRTGLDDREARILRGIARQMRWAARRRA